MWKDHAFGTRRYLLLWPRAQQRRHVSQRPLVDIKKATFYEAFPSEENSFRGNSPLFPGLTLSIPGAGNANPPQAIVPYALGVTATSAKTTTAFLKVLAGRFFCDPATARSYPHLTDTSKSPHSAIQYVGFDAERGSGVGGNSLRGAYLSARYESRRDEGHFTVRDYLQGNTELNSLERFGSPDSEFSLEAVSSLLGIGRFLDMSVANLSNGQTRRVRIAKALMKNPELLIIDGPFMGLDPHNKSEMGRSLRSLYQSTRIRLVLGLSKSHSTISPWLTQLVAIENNLSIFYNGPHPPPRNSVFARNPEMKTLLTGTDRVQRALARREKNQSPASDDSSFSKGIKSKDGFLQVSPPLSPGEKVVDMQGVKVTYGDKTALGDWAHSIHEKQSGLWWSLHRGQRCGIFGTNGSGKTTMLSLITSDHPQTYSLPIQIFGRSRLPGAGEPGISLFDIQKRMGHSSPEVHAFFPKQLTVRRAIESAWADAPLARPHLNEEADRKVDACLRWFARELNPTQTEDRRTFVEELTWIYKYTRRSSQCDRRDRMRRTYDQTVFDDTDIDWAHRTRFYELTFSNQRLVLFLRAIIAEPDLVILDEAFSGMDSTTRDKALLFLSHGEQISHIAAGKNEGHGEDSVLALIDAVRVKGLTPEQALLVISHSKDDVPGCVREWICLPEPGGGRRPRTGILRGPLELNPEGWDEIWGVREEEEVSTLERQTEE